MLCPMSLLATAKDAPPPILSIIPRPVVEKASGQRVVLIPPRMRLTIASPDQATPTITEGITLINNRAKALGYKIAVDEPAKAQIVLTRCSEETMAGLLKTHQIEQKLDPDRMKQAYHLLVDPSPSAKACIQIQAVNDWGLYYGMVSACQILDITDQRDLYAPAVEILDFPEIARRLVKTSAANLPEAVTQGAMMLPIFKISQIGLQFHGRSSTSSKEPGPDFTTNIKTLCSKLREAGTIETIVYFCPFRGQEDKDTGRTLGAYDFTVEADKSAYAEYLLWIMAQGAHGIQVDYNDWPGSLEVPISDVLNLAYNTVKKRYPNAYVLYCPPGRGKESYIGLPTPDLTQTLSRVPPGIWPLWTGLATLIRQPLPPETVEKYTKQAGRRPFLWLNRVGLEVKEPFTRKVPGLENRRVFAGDRLPQELNRLFEGVHFNTSYIPTTNRLPVVFNPEELVYLATAADFVWNPHQWEPAESYRRAKRFVEIMVPLLNTKLATQTAPE